ncbi:polyamine ABC transporter substrate-binding protein, partial [Pseudomonas syringae]
MSISILSNALLAAAGLTLSISAQAESTVLMYNWSEYNGTSTFE